MALEKTFDATASEQRIYAAWEQVGAFRAGANARDGASTYCIMIPPPNVTGVLHIGHAFNNTLQDILIRWKRMQGFDTLWQAGTDHAGIATQMVVERKLAAEGKPPRRDWARDDFTAEIWKWKQSSGDTIVNQLKRLGASCDWDRTAFTMSGAPNAPAGEEGNFHDAVIRVFVEMYNKGLIYRGKRLVNWDPHFETAISDLEVENVETPGHMWHFKYPLAGGATYEYVEKDEDGNVTLRETRDYISIATTRPETMLGDGAVAVHPSDERYAPIVGKLCEIPVGPKEHRRLIPIITDEYPDKDFGSGAVKITGAHDFNDYQVAKRGGIPMYRLMDTRGAMRADGATYAEAATIAMAVAKGERTLTEAEADTINLVPDDLRGLDRFEARDVVVRQITEEGLAVMVEVPEQVRDEAEGDGTAPDTDPGPQFIPYVENKPIMQPFGDRSKVVIEPMLTDQWFVDTDKIVGPALDAVREGEVKILPESGEKVYYNWLENIEPWCISRQLWWGHQIPVWFDADGNQYCAATEAEAQAKAGADVALTRDPDVLDTWFSSGLWPIGTLGWPEDTEALKKYFPTSTLITGQDIIFFWVARMMMMQLAVVDQIPFDTVYLHGLVRDAKGKKMSKSTGNVIDPLEIIDEYGADALRFTNAAMASLGGVLKLDMQRIAGYRNFGTKLWNAARFAEMNGAVGSDGTIPDATFAVNKWIIGETAQVRGVVDKALEEFRFNDAAQALYAFVWGKVCDWYVEFSKPLLLDGDDATKLETQKVMGWVIDQCLILLHPIMPFITEELWGTLADRQTMLVHTDWPTYGADLVDADADREMNWVIEVIETTRSVRAQMHVPAGLHVPVLVTQMDEAGKAAWARNETLIKRLARIDSLTEVDAFPKGCATLPVTGATFGLPLADIIDVDAEKARLEKTLGKLAKELGGLRGRLKNPKFAQSAPEEVVEETRANLAAREEEEAKLKDALKRLSEI
ncbi:valine--tRNA ligase [Marinovum sp. 2_MG-2023]|uniref:valine--tRNA ligase n=1 Tax=unclassified Marinovum TaxID=2647166 RepID=UPI0026E20B6B|nr:MULTISPECIES: valine--tRNA ligase [unclassified Marinovum]MDO6731513.1 valine--tRNA ligase [Marinovum sp. 2_MG-2023]MDO6780873.1 valine--tRNA ligase [Marinovum sp. 1_MG-2023]